MLLGSNLHSKNNQTSTQQKEDTDSDRTIDNIYEQQKRLRYYSEKREYGGTWEIENYDERSKVSKNLINISGVAKPTIIQFYQESNSNTLFKIINVLYDGQYRDQVVYQKIHLNTDKMVYSRKKNKVTIKMEKARIEISYGRLYSTTQDHDCFVNVTANFTEKSSNKISLSIELTSDGKCFPTEMTFDLDSPYEKSISKRRVINYAIIINILLIMY